MKKNLNPRQSLFFWMGIQGCTCSDPRRCKSNPCCNNRRIGEWWRSNSSLRCNRYHRGCHCLNGCDALFLNMIFHRRRRAMVWRISDLSRTSGGRYRNHQRHKREHGNQYYLPCWPFFCHRETQTSRFNIMYPQSRFSGNFFFRSWIVTLITSAFFFSYLAFFAACRTLFFMSEKISLQNIYSRNTTFKKWNFPSVKSGLFYPNRERK